MDRSYDAPTRSGRTSQHAIGNAPTPPATSRRTSTRAQETESEADASRHRRLGSLQNHFSDLLSVRSVEDLERQVRASPLTTIALAAGIGYALQRTRLLDGVIGAILSDDAPDNLSPAEERLLAWLNDAYALEKAQIPILENHAADAHAQPHVREKDLEHVEQTKRHAKKVGECIRLLGHKPSKVRGAIGRASGAMNSLTTEPFDDEVVRNFVADFASENLEVASYEAIIVAARDAGHDKIARICEEILEEEEAMADWLRAHLPRAVRDTLDDIGIADRQPTGA